MTGTLQQSVHFAFGACDEGLSVLRPVHMAPVQPAYLGSFYSLRGAVGGAICLSGLARAQNTAPDMGPAITDTISINLNESDDGGSPDTYFQ